MGGKSKSSQSSTTTNNVDNRVFDFGEGINGDANLIDVKNSENVTVTSTDHGAIDAAAGIANRALDVNLESLTESYEFAGDAFNRAIQTVNNSAEREANNSRNSLNSITDLTKSLSTGGQTDIAKNMQNVMFAIATAGVVITIVLKTRN